MTGQFRWISSLKACCHRAEAMKRDEFHLLPRNSDVIGSSAGAQDRCQRLFGGPGPQLKAN